MERRSSKSRLIERPIDEGRSGVASLTQLWKKNSFPLQISNCFFFHSYHFNDFLKVSLGATPRGQCYFLYVDFPIR